MLLQILCNPLAIFIIIYPTSLKCSSSTLYSACLWPSPAGFWHGKYWQIWQELSIRTLHSCFWLLVSNFLGWFNCFCFIIIVKITLLWKIHSTKPILGFNASLSSSICILILTEEKSADNELSCKFLHLFRVFTCLIIMFTLMWTLSRR